MLAIALMLGMLVAPFALWMSGYNALAGFVGLYVALSLPSIIKVFYLAITHREWPKIVGGPSFTWAGRSIGVCPEASFAETRAESKYVLSQNVRVRSSGVFDQLIHPHPHLIGKEGTIKRVEIGKYSKKFLYTVAFGAEKASFFENELELL